MVKAVTQNTRRKTYSQRSRFHLPRVLKKAREEADLIEHPNHNQHNERPNGLVVKPLKESS